MRLQSLVIASALAMGLASSVSAQETHRYVLLFKYGENAVKAMVENPQDREAQGAKVTAAFGGKQVAIFFTPAGGGFFDGFAIDELPDETAAQALKLFLKSTGNFPDVQVYPILSSVEFKAAMEKAKGVKSDYTPPTTTKQ